MSDTFDAPGSRNEAILQNMLGANNPLEPPGSRIEDLLQQLLEEGGGSGLPKVTAADNGKVLGVENGAWGTMDAPSGLPEVTTADENGMVLKVANGAWGIGTIATNITLPDGLGAKVVNCMNAAVADIISNSKSESTYASSVASDTMSVFINKILNVASVGGVPYGVTAPEENATLVTPVASVLVSGTDNTRLFVVRSSTSRVVTQIGDELVFFDVDVSYTRLEGLLNVVHVTVKKIQTDGSA